MAAGLGFKDFQTGEVLTAADVDGYLMQGIWVFASAAARDAAVTSPQEGNSCYLKDTDVIQVYSGSSWVTKSGGSPLTTKGDLYTFSTTDARLPVGANGTTLVADSAEATGLKWATPAGGGSLTLLSTTTLSGTTTISGISGSYRNLYVEIYGINCSSNANWFCNPNSSATSSSAGVYAEDTTPGLAMGGSASNIDLNTGNLTLAGDTSNAFAVTFFNYASSTNFKPFNVCGGFKNDAGGGRIESSFHGGYFRSNTAITSLQFSSSAGSFSAGTVKIYGVN